MARRFSKEFKLQVIQFANEQGNAKAVAKQLNIDYSILVRWKRELKLKKEDAFKGKGQWSGNKRKMLLEIQTLKKELKKVKLERDILSNLFIIDNK